MRNTMNKQEFVTKATQIHNNFYDYSKVEYVNTDIKVCIICPKHGEFWQNPQNHLNRQKCPKCAIEKKRGTTESFIEKAKKVHEYKYDYSKVEYVDCKTKVKIICKKHGVFIQRPDIHLSGSTCPHCAREEKLNTLDYYIQLSKEKHGDKYDFRNSRYSGCNNYIEVRCKECGNIFYISPVSLVKGVGCKMCNVEEQRRIACLDGEVWRNIKGFTGYQVSNIGRVRSIDRIVEVGKHTKRVDGMILKLINDKDGYKIVSLKKGCGGKSYRKRVHRLVADEFIDNTNNYDCIDHINGVRDDNRVENLRWCTNKQNANFELAKENKRNAALNSYKGNNTLRKLRAETFRKVKMQRVEVFDNGRSLGVFESQISAAEHLGVSQSLISVCMRKGTQSKNGLTVIKV